MQRQTVWLAPAPVQSSMNSFCSAAGYCCAAVGVVLTTAPLVEGVLAAVGVLPPREGVAMSRPIVAGVATARGRRGAGARCGVAVGLLREGVAVGAADRWRSRSCQVVAVGDEQLAVLLLEHQRLFRPLERRVVRVGEADRLHESC